MEVSYVGTIMEICSLLGHEYTTENIFCYVCQYPSFESIREIARIARFFTVHEYGPPGVELTDEYGSFIIFATPNDWYYEDILEIAAGIINIKQYPLSHERYSY